jgi:hypothetical protein
MSDIIAVELSNIAINLSIIIPGPVKLEKTGCSFRKYMRHALWLSSTATDALRLPHYYA